MDIPQELSEQVRYSAAPVLATLASGGEAAGSALFFHFSLGGGRAVPVLLTTRQLVDGAARLRFTFQDGVAREGRLEPIGASFSMEVAHLDQLVLPHPDPDVDLAALPLRSLQAPARRNGHHVFYVPFEEGFLGLDPVTRSLHRHERVVAVGFPSGQWDPAEGFPVLREGATLEHASEDFKGKALGVVDTACLPGAAGSAVLVLNEGGFRRGEAVEAGDRLMLLGVLSARPVEGAAGDGPDPAHYVKAREIVALGKAIRQKLGVG